MMNGRSILACLSALCGILGLLLFNDNVYTELTFSRESGFYEEPFELEIYAPPGTEIFYTLNGSEPDEKAIRYTGPIKMDDATQNDNIYSMRTDMSVFPYTLPDYPIDKCNVVNAVYRDTEGNFSEIKSRSYFVGYEEKRGYDELNIVSIVTDPDSLFDYDTGIYILGRAYDEYPNKEEDPSGWMFTSANYYRGGFEWERNANIEIFDSKRNPLLNQQCGIRIHGGGSCSYIPKSMNIYAREQYSGQKRFYTDLFNTQYMADTVTLFTGADDYISKVRDMLISRLTSHRNFATMHYVPCAMFLNGEYWGIYWITEKYNDVYLEYYYNTDKDNIVMIKNLYPAEGEDSDEALYKEMMDYMSNTDLSVNSNYQYACELVDIQSYIDYYAVEIYIANHDWPGYNEGLWRTRDAANETYEDCKWRWILYDVNLALSPDMTSADTFAYVLDESPMFNNLCQNEDFKRQFTITFMDLANTTFTNKNVDSVISEYVDLMEEPMNVHLKRFYGTEDAPNFPDAVADVQNFLDNRKPYIVQYLKDDFGLSGVPAPVEIEINDPEAGSIVLNTIEPSFDTDGKWSGEYYTDYPITLTAIANDGYRFVEWEVTDSSQKETLTEDTIETNISEQGISVKAVFEKTDGIRLFSHSYFS